MPDLSHRKSAVTLTLREASGHPMPGVTLEAELQRHEFLFGCGVFFAVPLCDPALPAEKRGLLESIWESWRALFHFGTLPFYQGRYEPVEGQTLEAPTLRAAKFLRQNGVTLKGHPLCWHTVSAMWDVINEVVIMPIFDKEDNAITRLCAKLGRVELVKRVFDMARAINPDATLLLNDFNTSEQYRQLIEDCLAADVPIDVIGIQSHQHQGFWGMEKLQEVLARFEGFGLPMHFTENTFVSGDLMPPHIVDLNDWQVPDWPTTPAGEDRQARDLLAMVDTLFAHPQVEAFTNWDFTDGAWLGAPAGLVRKDGSRKPSWEALHQRIHQDWHTRVTLQTNENGQCTLEGFRGEYVLRCLGREANVTLSKAEKAAEVTL